MRWTYNCKIRFHSWGLVPCGQLLAPSLCQATVDREHKSQHMSKTLLNMPTSFPISA